MASQGPFFPGTMVSVSNAGTSENAEVWVNPGNIGSDNGTEATITAATFDSPDISQLLVARNYGFSIPATATIDGIVVEIDRRNSAGAASDNRVQLATSTTFGTLVGDNKAATATDWPTATAVATYGSPTDDWNAGLTPSQINSSGFGVWLSAQADAANTDIQVDYIRVTVHYTEAAGGSVTATPTPASLTLTTLAPTVTATDHKVVTPGPTSLTLTAFAPTVSVSDHKTVTPAPASLVLTPFAPTVSVTTGDDVTVTPDAAALTITGFAPTVAASNHVVVTPSPASLALTAFAPDVVLTSHQLIVPPPASLVLTTFAPTVTGTSEEPRRRVVPLDPDKETIVAQSLYDDLVGRYGPEEGPQVYFAMEREGKGPFGPGMKYDVSARLERRPRNRVVVAKRRSQQDLRKFTDSIVRRWGK